MQFRTVAAALEKCAAPALAISRFLSAVVAEHRLAIDEKRTLFKRRSLVAFRIVKRRDGHGRFVKIAPLRDELAEINARLHAA